MAAKFRAYLITIITILEGALNCICGLISKHDNICCVYKCNEIFLIEIIISYVVAL